jgi:hypothetical protein
MLYLFLVNDLINSMSVVGYCGDIAVCKGLFGLHNENVLPRMMCRLTNQDNKFKSL